MADINVNLKRALDGPGPQHKVKDQTAFEFSEGSNGALHVKVTDEQGNPIDPRRAVGSYAILKGEPMPEGNQNDTLLEYDESTGETAVYKYISGAWREL